MLMVHIQGVLSTTWRNKRRFPIRIMFALWTRHVCIVKKEMCFGSNLYSFHRYFVSSFRKYDLSHCKRATFDIYVLHGYHDSLHRYTLEIDAFNQWCNVSYLLRSFLFIWRLEITLFASAWMVMHLFNRFM